MFPDWERAAAGLVAGFREAVGTDTDNPRFIELVGEMSLASPLFRRLWARHDVRHRGSAVMAFHHPLVGDITLNREKLLVTGTEGIMLVAYHADPGSVDADKLAILGSAALPPVAPRERADPHGR